MFFKNLNQIKMKKLIFGVCLFVQVGHAQNNYGEFTYPHNNISVMSSGITSTVAGQPGFIMAGYNSSAAPYHFTIDRTDMGGAFNGSTFEFQKDYNVFADVSGSCVLTNTTSVNSSYAVSIIQTTLSTIGARYALVGAFDEGCYLCFIDGAGSVINTNVFWFPFPAGTNPSTITKPLIKEDSGNPGTYFICGSYSNIMYAMGIDYTGTVNWSKIYAIDGRPNDMIESGSDLIIVGQTTTLNAVPDGFVCRILGNTPLAGNVTYFNVFDGISGYYQNFSCVAPTSTPSAGFIVGGSCETSPGVFRAYNLNVQGGGTMNWDNVITSTADIAASDFVGITERNTNVATNIEYYGVMTSTVGLIVSKMNFLGIPTYTGPGAPLDEFVYNAPGVNLTATGISLLNNSSGNDVGLHIFGTDMNSGIPAPYLAQAYFSGESGCNTPSFHFTTNSVICTSYAVALSPTAGLSICNAINILDANTSAKINYCGPNNSVANGSNLRPTSIHEFSTMKANDLKVLVKPHENSLLISCQNSREISSVFISNILGQKVFENSISDLTIDSNNTNQILFNNLNLQTGTYLLTIVSPSGIQSKKFMYTVE